MPEEEIAIIGMGLRFPGGVNDVEAFWKLLSEGEDAVSEIPADRWNIDRFYDPEPGIPGKSIAKWGGFVDGIDQFDPQFFGISPREAPFIDPQQRLLLETAWEAMEDAGLVLDFENGSDVGVYVGVSHTDYQNIQSGSTERVGISPHSSTGNAHSIGANRISYCFNLLGPSIAMDTACSSALTAVHVACEQLQKGHCGVALAGGVTVMITPDGYIGFSQAGMLSPDGRCRAFDASANGFVRGEGAGMVVLKPLSKAIEDGDPVYATILASSANQDGHTNGISLPGEDAQARLVAKACEEAGIDPKEIGYVEAHGTGTAVGDPIEAHALSRALCKGREVDDPLPIGSVKSNLGHLETAAGVASLVKSALVISRGQIPASIHFESPNPNIDFDETRLRVPTEMETFPVRPGGRKLVGINSFGFGGANTHVILGDAPKREQGASKREAVASADRSWPIVLSARSEESLSAAAGDLADWLQRHGSGNGSSPLLPDLVYTLGARRNHHSYRLTVGASSIEGLAEELRGFTEDAAGGAVKAAFSPQPENPLRVGFVMSGQGPQWWGMGRQLMAAEPVFKEAIEACATAMKPHARFSLLEELARDEDDSRIKQTEVGQPAIFAMQYALATLWKSWGVEPAAITGHSVGEIAAACVAGILSLEEAARVIVLRGQVMHETARGAGTMLAVGLSQSEAEALIERHGDKDVSIAAFNGPRSLTLSGPKSSLEKMAEELDADEVFARFVKVDHPFHHAFMQPAADQMKETLADLEPQASSVPFFSTVTGELCAGESCTAEHWANGIRQAVQFVSAVDAVADHGVDLWLELSAHPALSISIQECLADRGEKSTVVSSCRREREQDSFVEAGLQLHLAGVVLDFEAMTPSRQLLSLPAYPWNKARWWNEASELRDARLQPGGKGLLDMRVPRALPVWLTHLDERHLAYLRDHKVDTHVIFPAAGFVEMTLEAGQQLFEGQPFAIEDFEIRKPLIVPDPASGLVLEFTFDPSDRSFSIQSRMDSASSWNVHVVGFLRGERTESSFGETTWSRPDESLIPLETDEFYEYMANLGLRYGPEFKPVQSLWAGRGESAGEVKLSDATAERASEYALHPVLLDGALHVFSAGARTVEDRRASMKLPVRFARILFLKTPGASTRVRSEVLVCNEEILEGRIGLYDEQDQPCVLVDGFRAVAMTAVRRAGSTGATRDLVYQVDWETKPASNATAVSDGAIPLEELAEAGRKALDEVLDMRGRETLEAAMAAEDRLAAAQVARGLVDMGVDIEKRPVFSVKSLGVAEEMERPFGVLMDKLEGRGLVKASATGWKPLAAFGKAAKSAGDELATFVREHPGHLPEGLLSEASGSQLGSILSGETDAVQAFFGGSGSDLLEHFYGDGLFTSHWLAALAAIVKEAADRLPEGRKLRILEVGAGTGALAAYLLPLLDRGVHQYVFTDISAGFFQPAQQKLANFPEVDYKVLNLDRSPSEQGFDDASFDLIIGTNVVHATADVRESLGRLHDLLDAGGTLAFMDVATPQLWTESIFGLTSGWWASTDRDLRPDQPLLPRETWVSLMEEVGFESTASLPGLIGPSGGESQVGLLGRKAWAPKSEDTNVASTPVDAEAQSPDAEADAEAAEGETEEEVVVEPFHADTVILVADESDLADGLAERASAEGAAILRVSRGSALSLGESVATLRADLADDWQALFAAVAERSGSKRFVWLWAAERPGALDSDDGRIGTDELLHFAHGLEKLNPTDPVRVDVVTRGAQPIGRDFAGLNVSQGASIGLFRVMMNENTAFSFGAIDLPAAVSESDVASLWREMQNTDGEREVALRGDARYVQRLDRGLPEPQRQLDPSVPLRLESKERGILDSLGFTPTVMPECAPDEVLIRVRAAGMNFRDVLKALALYPAETEDARMYGDEVAGEIVAVGSEVDHVKVGDRVFGLAVFGLATHTLARGADVLPIPEGVSYEEASTIPVVFMTAWFALKDTARVKPGETILVHAGAGGVGMAAIQIAHHLGAEVIASAGSPTKRALLKTLGVKEVIDSRRGDFAERIMELTDRRGVDVVLNSLASEAIPMGLSCLAEFGRFVEIGKRDIYQNSRLPLWALRRNASFHVVAMDAVFAGDASLTRDLMAEITTLVAKRKLTPLPFRAFPMNRVDAAFRLMAAGKHTGKVVVSFAEPFIRRVGELPTPAFTGKPDGTYLITGGLGGFGRVLSRWLAEAGAKHLVLSSRKGLETPGAGEFVEELAELGVEAEVVKADVGQTKEVDSLFQAIDKTGRPLKGVFHLAMVIDDAPLGALDPERFEAVVRPKALGGWLLHEKTKDLELDAFVLFSSISSVFGNPAQGNYSAANGCLDALAHHRRSLGLPGLAINWGVLGGDGYVARNEKVAEFLSRQGTDALEPSEVTALLESFIDANVAQVASIRVDWAKWRQHVKKIADNPLLERIFASGVEFEDSGSGTGDWAARIEAATAGERDAIVVQAVQDVVGTVLRVKPDTLRPDQPLTDLGLDSLMGVEIENLIESSIGVTLPPTSLMRARTIGQIAALISEHLGGEGSAGAAATAAEQAPAEPEVEVSEVDLDALSDEDLDRLLGEEDEADAKADSDASEEAEAAASSRGS